jgi:anti-anti-sigma factor
VVSGVPVVAAPEEIDVPNADALRWALLEAAAHGHGTLVVDMTATRFCDSSGLHTLLAAHNRAQAEGGELLLVIPDIVRFRIFQITGIDRVIPRVTSLDQALAQTSADGPGACGEWTAHLIAVTGCPRSMAVASLPEKPADRVTPDRAGRTRQVQEAQNG